MGEFAHADLPFRHGLEQCGLYLGRGAVDFVCQHQVVEYGAGLEHKAAVLGPVDFRPGYIRRQQVRCELNAMEVAFQSRCQGLDGFGFGQTGCAFHQQMAIRQNGNQ